VCTRRGVTASAFFSSKKWQHKKMNIIEFGDCRETMRKWKEQGIKAQTCVTSPPYYGLRDYGHDGQIGLEETPEEYIAAMVDVFRCVWDVLEDNGTLWLNIGDSYYNYRPGQGQRQGKQSIASQKFSEVEICHKRGLKLDGLKEKDLIGIPWMLAFALRADGWYLRQDIIWHKPNPMPESVQDRCTKSHEYIFLMSKSQKYYYDSDSIKEDAITAGSVSASFQGRQGTAEYHAQSGGAGSDAKEYTHKNKRSVWSIPVKPYEGAHFAVFPIELIQPCILAGAPVGGIVLDPFMGSGTTAQVAQHLGRQYLGCELNPEYKPLQDKRISQMSLVLE
jgi:DNA modification methylase